MVLDTGGSKTVYAVAFHPDGKHLFGGGLDGIQQWQLSDGREVRKRTGMCLYAIDVSKDHKWVVCGTYDGASVWDGDMDEKLIDVEGGNRVLAVDVCPDSTRFATGTDKSEMSIWSIPKGERLVGPLRHDRSVTGVKFSPNGEQIANACYGGSICIFDSRNGDELITINTTMPYITAITPLAWSSDGQRIFATSDDDKVRSFDVSSGSQLAELEVPGRICSLALAPNCKFIAIFASSELDTSISFLDASTLARTGPVIENTKMIWSIAISTDSSSLATGQYDGKIVIRNLSQILPDLYGPFDVRICALIVPHVKQAPH